jgi:hypothetical protein
VTKNKDTPIFFLQKTAYSDKELKFLFIVIINTLFLSLTGTETGTDQKPLALYRHSKVRIIWLIKSFLG